MIMKYVEIYIILMLYICYLNINKYVDYLSLSDNHLIWNFSIAENM